MIEKNEKISLNSKILVNPSVVLREESDNWALLYDPDTGNTYGINPVSVFIWKQLNGKNGIKEITEKVHRHCTNVPGDVESHIEEFVSDLLEKGYAKEFCERK